MSISKFFKTKQNKYFIFVGDHLLKEKYGNLYLWAAPFSLGSFSHSFIDLLSILKHVCAKLKVWVEFQRVWEVQDWTSLLYRSMPSLSGIKNQTTCIQFNPVVSRENCLLPYVYYITSMICMPEKGVHLWPSPFLPKIQSGISFPFEAA